MEFGVISYLPNDERVRRIRWKTTEKCLVNLLEVASWCGAPLHVITTNWRQEEKNKIREKAKDYCGVVFVDVDMSRRGPAVSRNILLKGLYESDQDYMMICDDDAHVYPYYEIKDFIEDIDSFPQKYLEKGLYHICAHLANSAPFKEKNMSDSEFCGNWVFRAGGDHAGRCPQIFANYKKHFGKEFYQEEKLFNELHIGGEDEIFNIALMQAGVMIYTMTSLIAGTVEVTSSFWDEKKSKQDMLKDAVWTEGQPTLDYIMSLYPKAKQITKYRLDTSAYRPKHKDRIIVPRERKYEPSAWDFPVKRSGKQKLGLLKKIGTQRS